MRSLWAAALLLACAAPLRAQSDKQAQPPGFLRSLTDAIPPIIYNLASASYRGKLFVFYDQGPMVPRQPDVAVPPGQEPKSAYRVWDGAAWGAEERFYSVSQAVNVGDELWALGDGGYYVSRDGLTWSDLVAKPEWKQPSACVANGQLWVFYNDGDGFYRTGYADGHWTQPESLDLGSKPKAVELPLMSDGNRLRAASFGDQVWLFWTQGAGNVATTYYETFTGGHWSDRQTFDGGAHVQALAEGNQLYLFYQDTRPPQMSTPSIAGIFKAVKEMQAKAGQTFYQRFSSAAWSPAESVLTGQSLTLNAVVHENAIWLFTSSGQAIQYVNNKGGAWSAPALITGMSNAGFSSPKLTAGLAGLWLVIMVPMLGLFAVTVWAASSMIEARRRVVLDLAGRRRQCASLFRRFCAALIDSALYTPISFLYPQALAAAGFSYGPGKSLMPWLGLMLVPLGCFFLYFVLCEARWGKTIGKRICGVTVISKDGGPCTGKGALARTFFRFLDACSLHLIGAIVYANSAERQRVGDMVGGTLVVLDELPPQEAPASAPAATA